jgi:squalene cyclase
MNKIMRQNVESAVRRGIAFLLTQQTKAGCFEGRLSSSTFPTCATAWIQLAQGQLPSTAQIDWFIKNQNADGTWGLDAANHPNSEATLFAKLILEQIAKRQPTPQISQALARSPKYPLNEALNKLAYAAFGAFDWNKLTLSKQMLPVIKLMPRLLKTFPFLQNHLKPPRHILPPVDLFGTPMFESLFIAEQYTLVPVFIMIELNTTKRSEIINALYDWLKSHTLSDGSWFCVNYITALSVLALLELQKQRGDDAELGAMIDRGLAWLETTRNPDGGCREAINLNVWDTGLSVSALSIIDPAEAGDNISSACKWLIEVQNPDGGWAFTGLPDGSLPSDADDTALATLALLRFQGRSALSQESRYAEAVTRGLDWLRSQQGKNGSWATYIPGQGDVGCVSITAHAIEALLAAGDMDAEIDRACEWLKGQISSEGYWTDLWLAKHTYGTANAIIALVKSRESLTTSTASEIERGVSWLESVQNSDGGWGEDMFGVCRESTVEQTAWATYALLLANPKSQAAEKGLDFLLDRQKSDGSWNAGCVGIYWEVIGGYIDPIYASVFPLLALSESLKAILKAN